MRGSDDTTPTLLRESSLRPSLRQLMRRHPVWEASTLFRVSCDSSTGSGSAIPYSPKHRSARSETLEIRNTDISRPGAIEGSDGRPLCGSHRFGFDSVLVNERE